MRNSGINNCVRIIIYENSCQRRKLIIRKSHYAAGGRRSVRQIKQKRYNKCVLYVMAKSFSYQVQFLVKLKEKQVDFSG
jgi:hypothetical protein